jgi:carbonic anhydrase/acetyltransferase-like protein (isoleucine patch superfamily)
MNKKGKNVFIATGAYVMGDVFLDDDSSVWYGAVVRGDTEHIYVGKRSNIQDGAILHADPTDPTHIGNDVTVGHGAIVHGASIGDGSLVGMRATVLNGAKIGRCCIVGANALVPERMEVPDFSMVLGVPAKIVKTLPESIAAKLQASADHYVKEAQAHAAGKFPLM